MQEIAAQHQADRSIQDAALARQREERSKRETHVREGMSDLDDICEDGLHAIRAALPDFEYKRAESRLLHMFEGTDGELNLWVWGASMVDEHTSYVLAGEIQGKPSQQETRRLANIAFTADEGRFTWKVYRFRVAERAATREEVGRQVGLEHQFFKSLWDPRDPSIPTLWDQPNIVRLDANILVALLVEALQPKW